MNAVKNLLAKALEDAHALAVLHFQLDRADELPDVKLDLVLLDAVLDLRAALNRVRTILTWPSDADSKDTSVSDLLADRPADAVSDPPY